MDIKEHSQTRYSELVRCYPSRLSKDYKGRNIPSMKPFSGQPVMNWLLAVEKDMAEINELA